MVGLGVLAPHPPLLIPEIGVKHLREVRATDEAMREMARRVLDTSPESLVVLSPHGPLYRDAVAVNLNPVLKGGFESFGARERLTFDNDVDLAEAIAIGLEAHEIGVARLTPEHPVAQRMELDHGVLVPMHYLREAGYSGKLVSLTMTLLPPDLLYQVGVVIQEAARRKDRRIVTVASGDLSHRLTPDAPAGFNPRGAVFDRKIIELLGQGDVHGVMSLDEELCEAAGECGYRTIIMMLGALDGWEIEPTVLSYEGPFGVGYGVATFAPVRRVKEG